MKKRFLTLIPLLLSMVACGAAAVAVHAERKTIDFDNLPANTFTPTAVSGELGDFNLVSPHNGMIAENINKFSWEASENADTYTLEICSDPNFVSDNEKIDYYKKDNIHATSFTINSLLRDTDYDYYWRVYAVNSTGKKESSETFSFHIQAPEVDSVEFDIGEADDWSLHQDGSPAEISIDNSDFFGNGKESLVIKFKEEDTNHGSIKSVGWIIVTRTIEKNTYGADSLFFNMYYSGQDSTIFVRVVDDDNEFWHIPVNVSGNSKQSIVVQFKNFEQRTRDVTIGNLTFDYNRIKYFEIVFEETFGDGVLLLSDLKAVKYKDYEDMFITKLNFEEYDDDVWTNEEYTFTRTVNESELKLTHDTSDGKAKINGYGFAKLNVNKKFSDGDAVRVSVKYEGPAGSNVIIRIYEEDEDRWSYKFPYKQLTEGEYTDYVIPFQAFAKSSIQGDGKRQFYQIKNIQFGLEGQYTSLEGSVYFKDFEIVSKKDYITEEEREVDSDGLVEDFNGYSNNSEIFMIWRTTSVNKDEYMSLSSDYKVGGKSNPYSGKFEYKADMKEAQYGLPLKLNFVNFSSISLWMKDASVKDSNAKYNTLTDVSPKTTFTIYLKNGKEYTYTLPSLERYWHEYVIPFSEFKLNGNAGVTAEAIAGFGFAFQYFYKDAYGNPAPSYHDDNVVYIDNIKFGNATTFSKTLLEEILHQDENGITLVDNFEKYPDTDELEGAWADGRDFDYQKKELSNVVSSEGGNKSMAMQYKINGDSPSYYVSPNIADDVTARGIKFSFMSELNVTLYLNFYLRIGSSLVQYRATIQVQGGSWCEYSLGFGSNNFTVVSGTAGRSFTYKDLVNVYRISFGMVGYKALEDGDNGLRNVYVDNIKFDNSLSYSTNNTRVIA